MKNLHRISKFMIFLASILIGASIGNAQSITWTASWISYNNSENFPLFRRVFTVNKPVASATASVCGLGL
ncbi:MAG: hypothetical protein ABSE00_06755, partial [Chitinispirillaceae bacterium]